MVKSEIGSLDGNIFFPCISKNDSLYFGSESTNVYGTNRRAKTKLKQRMTGYNTSMTGSSYLHNR